MNSENIPSSYSQCIVITEPIFSCTKFQLNLAITDIMGPIKFIYNTVGTQFNDPEGIGDFWLLNPSVVKSNF